MLQLFRTILLVLITVLTTIFVVQNLATTEVAFLTWSIAAPRAVVLLALFGLGLLFGYLLRALWPRRRADSPPAPPSAGESEGSPWR
ncbi:MAG: DUF1049 domain-containing protein [Hyphomonadaceae bacterium]